MSRPILVDSSVWILFFNGTKSKEVSYLRKAIYEDQPLFLCPVIIQEILQGIKSDKDYKQVKDSLLAFSILDWDPIIASIAAADLYRQLRKKGITIRKSNDCLIAAYAQQFDLTILHLDRDFSVMATAKLIREVASF